MHFVAILLFCLIAPISTKRCDRSGQCCCVPRHKCTDEVTESRSLFKDEDGDEDEDYDGDYDDDDEDYDEDDEDEDYDNDDEGYDDDEDYDEDDDDEGHDEDDDDEGHDEDDDGGNYDDEDEEADDEDDNYDEHEEDSRGLVRKGRRKALKCPRRQVTCCKKRRYKKPKHNKPDCPGNKKCCCVKKGTCGTDKAGAGIVQPRIVVKPCPYGKEYCCAEPDDGDYSDTLLDLRALNGKHCGRSKSHPRSRYHGEFGYADFGEYDFVVALLDEHNNFIGAGALIDSRTVVTADHKVFNLTKSEIKVRARDWNAVKTNEPYRHIDRNVKRIYSHPSSDVRKNERTNLKNDVAVLKLSKPINLKKQKYVGSICIPEPQADFTGKVCWVAGWGQDAHGYWGDLQKKMKEVDLQVLPQRECKQLLRKTQLGKDFEYDEDSFICAGGAEGRDACSGDGGGPLMCKVDGRWFLAGMVAWGIDCGKEDVPGVYVNVPRFSKWIMKKSRSGGYEDDTYDSGDTFVDDSSYGDGDHYYENKYGGSSRGPHGFYKLLGYFKK